MVRLRQTQVHYRDLLRGLDTFQMTGEAPIVVPANETIAQLYEMAGTVEGRGAMKASALRLLLELDRVTSQTCPFIYYIVITGVPAGRPDFAGPLSSGGGTVITYCSGLMNKNETAEPRRSTFSGSRGKNSYYDLHTCGYLLRTVAHELGHAFGLVHSNDYGYDGAEAISVMCNRQWRLIPEELYVLGMNKRVFPNFSFDPSIDNHWCYFRG